MDVTAELSLYPLKTEYEAAIIGFIQTLKANSDLKVNTHAMSTYITGDSTKVMLAIDTAMQECHKEGVTFSLVIKAINRVLPVDKGFLDF